MYLPSGENDIPKIVSRCPPMQRRSFLGDDFVEDALLALVLFEVAEEDGSGRPKKAEWRRLAS